MTAASGADQPTLRDRYWQCDDTCTVDCGACKGQGRPTLRDQLADEAAKHEIRIEDLTREPPEIVWHVACSCGWAGGPCEVGRGLDDAARRRWQLHQADALLPVVERAKAEAAAEALPASVDQLTREHFGCWVEIPTRQVAGYLYAVHDDFNDGYPGRTLVLVGEDGAAAVEEEFTDSSPAGYPRTLHAACVVTPDRPIVGPDQLELPRGDRT